MTFYCFVLCLMNKRTFVGYFIYDHFVCYRQLIPGNDYKKRYFSVSILKIFVEFSENGKVFFSMPRKILRSSVAQLVNTLHRAIQTLLSVKWHLWLTFNHQKMIWKQFWFAIVEKLCLTMWIESLFSVKIIIYFWVQMSLIGSYIIINAILTIHTDRSTRKR